MTRTKKRYNAIGRNDSTCGEGGSIYSVALYARLSEDREDHPSESIENQLEIMRRFIKDKPELASCREFTDRDYSGTNFNRPGFKAMMDEIRSGRVNCVIVKDLSRLGRDLYETSNLIEVFFKFMNVRFISVNDHFDSIEESNGNKEMEVYLKNLVNDVYAKDVSRRISSVREQEQAQGKFLGTHAPYGYRIDKENPLRRFIIDEPAADVVRDIFNMVLDGMSLRDISRELQRRKLNIPGKYARTYELYSESDDDIIWRTGTISSMLSNETYIGNLILGKRKTRLCDGQVTKYQDKDEWIIIRNAHESIVSEETFRDVQKLLEQRAADSTFARKRTDEYPMKDNKYAGLLFCSQCGAPMTFCSEIRSGGRNFYYHCENNYRINKDRCTTRISEKTLDKALAASITALYKEELKAAVGADIKCMYENILKQEEAGYLRKRKTMTGRQQRIINIQSRDYENYVSGRITRNALISSNEQNDKAMAEVECDIRKLDAAFAEFKAGVKKRMKWAVFLSGSFSGSLSGSKDKEILSADLIKVLVKRIDVYSGHKIHVTYNFTEPGGDANE